MLWGFVRGFDKVFIGLWFRVSEAFCRVYGTGPIGFIVYGFVRVL